MQVFVILWFTFWFSFPILYEIQLQGSQNIIKHLTRNSFGHLIWLGTRPLKEEFREPFSGISLWPVLASPKLGTCISLSHHLTLGNKDCVCVCVHKIHAGLACFTEQWWQTEAARSFVASLALRISPVLQISKIASLLEKITGDAYEALVVLPGASFTVLIRDQCGFQNI